MKFNKKELEEILPHRDPMLLLDEAELKLKTRGKNKGKPKKSIAYYKVRGDEFFLQGHFPEFPVVPGVILCEMMAQACCMFFTDQQDKVATRAFLTKLNNAKFKNPVVPGDTVRIECKKLRQIRMFTFAEGEVFIGEKLCAKAKFTFAVMPNKK